MSTDVPASSTIDEEKDFSLLAIMTLILRHRWLFIRLPLLCGLIAAVITLAMKHTWTSRAAFVGKASSLQSPLAGIASQFGVKVPGSQSEFSPAFYVELVQSPTTLGPLVDSVPDWVPTASGVTSIEALYRARGRTPALKRQSAIEKLGKNISVSSERETGIVRVAVRARDAKAAAAITAAIVDKVSAFHMQSRRLSATQERQFVEERLRDAQAEQRRAEDALRNFLERNVTFGRSQQLIFENQRLEREVSMRQEVVTTLTQSYEQARIDEVRNLPVINIVESPTVAAKADPRRTVTHTLLGITLGLCLALLIAVLREVMRRDELRERDLAAEYRDLAAESRAELRSPSRVIGNILGRTRAAR
jgi:uncharacterized protein involved in exopolysaccharide biosynthesis